MNGFCTNEFNKQKVTLMKYIILFLILSTFLFSCKSKSVKKTENTIDQLNGTWTLEETWKRQDSLSYTDHYRLIFNYPFKSDKIIFADSLHGFLNHIKINIDEENLIISKQTVQDTTGLEWEIKGDGTLIGDILQITYTSILTDSTRNISWRGTCTGTKN